MKKNERKTAARTIVCSNPDGSVGSEISSQEERTVTRHAKSSGSLTEARQSEDRAVCSAADIRSENLERLQRTAAGMLDIAYRAVAELASARTENKMSNTRAAGVARELRELIKVMSVYDCR